MYSITPIFLRHYDATLLNLSVLTSDVYAVIAGVKLFGEHLHFLYFFAFAVVVAGVFVYPRSFVT